MRRPLLLALSLLLPLLLLWQYFSPHLTVRAMHRAAEAGDAEAFSRHVDYPAVRASLKAQLAGEVAERTQGLRLGGLERLAGRLAMAVAAPAMDAMVSPQGLQLLFLGRDWWRAALPGDAADGGRGADALRDARAAADPADPRRPDAAALGSDAGSDAGPDTLPERAMGMRARAGYRDLSTFAVEIRDAGIGDRPVTLIYSRHALLRWKLSAVEFGGTADDSAEPTGAPGRDG